MPLQVVFLRSYFQKQEDRRRELAFLGILICAVILVLFVPVLLALLTSHDPLGVGRMFKVNKIRFGLSRFRLRHGAGSSSPLLAPSKLC